MSKKFKDKLCAYCSTAPATTKDHVFSRKFFLEKDRGNLPDAPACAACNGKKAKLELYLTAVLPFAARHKEATKNLLHGVPRRLVKNRKLQRELSRTMEPAWLREGSELYQPTSIVSFDGTKLEELLKYIGRGLAWYHWAVYLGPEDGVDVLILTDHASALMQSFISPRNFPTGLVKDLGGGTVWYEGAQATEPVTLTVWKIVMYGGVLLSSDKRTAGTDAVTSSQWWIITGPPEVTSMVDHLKRSNARKDASVISSSETV